MKQKSKHRVFLFMEKKKKIFKQFQQNKFSTVLIKTIYNIRRGSTRRDVHVNTQYSKNTEWRIAK